MSGPVNSVEQEHKPLCVDLDGTLVRTDTMQECVLSLLRQKPGWIFRLPFWLAGGKAGFKRRLAENCSLDAEGLPYNVQVLERLRAEKQAGRTLVLATGADLGVARQVADHTGLFDQVLASDGQNNLTGQAKMTALKDRFNTKGYDYAGNSQVDLPIWRDCGQAILVDPPPSLIKRVADEGISYTVIQDKPRRSLALSAIKALRPYQWAKNLLVALPLLMAHDFRRPQLLLALLLAFAAYCMVSSGVYLINDLMDLPADRRHHQKRHRPLASGEMPPWLGMLLAPLLIAGGAALALSLPRSFGLFLSTYLALSLAYCWRLKQLALVDILSLAGLYTLRVLSGGAATSIDVSTWLLIFTMFLFISLAFLKRYSELHNLALGQRKRALGRGYSVGDKNFVAMGGVASGYAAVVIVALYINSPKVSSLYARPEWLILILPLILFWISRVWLLATRGLMREDPIVFTIKDRASYATMGLAVIVFYLAL